MDADKQKQLEEKRKAQQTAADLIRNKLNNFYGTEPNASEEMAEVVIMPDADMSPHQRYMKELNDSGRSMAEVQTAWHEYYAKLNDDEKHEVWKEFYSEHERAKQAASKPVQSEPAATPVVSPVSNNTAALAKKKPRKKKVANVDLGAANDVKQHLLSKVQERAEVTKNPHVRALGFGLTMGALTVFVLLFGFFNERFITPFIRPNTNVSATPIIVDPSNTGPVGPEAKIIIPKINVEAPVNYNVPTIQEADVQKGLEDGVVHYITTPNPGEKGNSVIFGHSSSNILNKGKYKFAFILLKSLDKDDTFIIQKDGKRYVYKVYNKFVTAPTDLSVLGGAPADKPAIMTLITCDPPGTSTNRLIVQAEQIFPDPNANAASNVQQGAEVSQQATQLPSNSVSMWQRIKNWF